MTDLATVEENQPVVIPQTNITPLTPAALLEIAVSQGADLDKLEKLMDLQDRYEKNEARKAYVTAMAEFKKNPPEIIKDMKVSFDTAAGTTSYDHASLANVTSVIGTELSKYGLSGRWDVEQGDFGIKVTFILTHIAGHSEKVSMIAPADNSGKKNPIQAIASTTSYLERYTMLAGTGLAAKGMDTDGKLPEAEPEPINQEQIDEIEELKAQGSASKTQFIEWLEKEYSVKAIDRLDTVQGNAIIQRLTKKAAHESEGKAA